MTPLGKNNLMKIKSVEFVDSVASLKQLPKDQLPQIAFGGRSNVGKSSLLNVLFNRKKMALVSSTPGKTRLLNFFRINDACYFVDLPGYGYAKAPKSVQQKWQQLIEKYLQSCEQLRGMVLLTDIRHDVQESDAQLIEWLAAVRIPLILVGTKADKLSKNKLNQQIAQNLRAFSPLRVDKIIPFSSVTGAGKVELLMSISELLKLPTII